MVHAIRAGDRSTENNHKTTRSIWKMLGPFATASRLTPIHQMSLAVLSRAACASMSTTTTTTTTTRDRGDRHGPMEWAQLWAYYWRNVRPKTICSSHRWPFRFSLWLDETLSTAAKDRQPMTSYWCSVETVYGSVRARPIIIEIISSAFGSMFWPLLVASWPYSHASSN